MIVDGGKTLKPIYEPKGAAKEYADYALNIYTGCPHRCFYCYCPNILRRDREDFYSNVEPRKNIVRATKLQLEREGITGKLIHLCFVGDPYPTGYDSTPTREIIKLLKEHGNHVQILTKGDGRRDMDLLDSGDWYGTTISGYKDNAVKKYEPGAIMAFDRLCCLAEAKKRGINTWVSFEPVLFPDDVMHIIESRPYIDKIMIGKLNYHPSDINWKSFGAEVESLCKRFKRNYYIKESLRKEM